MFDVGWSEMLVIAAVAIVVLGPKELPRALRTFGQYMAKARAMAREFQSNVDEMVREAELDELRKEANSIVNFDPKERIGHDPTGSRDGKFDASRPQGQVAGEPEQAADPTPADPYPVDTKAPPHSLQVGEGEGRGAEAPTDGERPLAQSQTG